MTRGEKIRKVAGGVLVKEPTRACAICGKPIRRYGLSWVHHGVENWISWLDINDKHEARPEARNRENMQIAQPSTTRSWEIR